MSGNSVARVLFVHTVPLLDPSLIERLADLGHDVTTSLLGETAEPGARPFDVIVAHLALESPAQAKDLSRHVEMHSDLETIVLLDSSDPTVEIAALSAGASCSIRWPCDVSILERLLVRALGRRKARGGTSEDQHRYRRLVDNAPIGVFEIEDGTLTYVNDFLEQVSGYSREELIGRPAVELVADGDRERLIAALSARARGTTSEPPSVYRLVGKTGEIYVGEVRSRLIAGSDPVKLEGTIRDITRETRLTRLHRAVLELGETILAEQDIDRILHLVLDTITEHSGFRRAVLSLYDLSIPIPFDGDVYKVLSSGLSREEEAALLAQEAMPVAQRRLAFSEKFRLGPAHYIPHSKTPWPTEWGIAGTVSVEGWHVDDFLFIPLRGTSGIIGSISVDDPIDRSAPTIASIEPVASLASFAALAVERVYKLNQLRRQKDRLRGLWGFGSELSETDDVETLCELAARRARDDMDYDYCAIWIVEGTEMVKLGMSTKPLFPPEEVPGKGLRAPVEGKGLTRWALKYQEPVIAPDVRSDDRYNGSRASIRSVIAIPLSGRRGPLGVIGVESRRLAAFGDEDVEVLSALASQLCVAISALQRREALQRIYAFGQRVAAATATEQVVSSTLDFLDDQFDYELSALFLTNAAGSLAIADVRGPYAQSGVEPGWILPSGTGIVGWVARNQRGILVEDVADDPRYFEAFGETRSELAVPILLSGNLLGVLNIESRFRSFFDDEDRQLLEVIANHLAIALANLASQESLRDQAIRDPLTGLYNRHYFNSLITPELNRSDRYGHPLTLMMVDVDGFRAINNRFGHLKGDEVLREVAIFLTESVRAADRVIRYGGDEFLIFMPETDEEAPHVAQRLRERITSIPRRIGVHGVEIGLSIGIYTRRPKETRTLEAILEDVDQRMYADKRKESAGFDDGDHR